MLAFSPDRVDPSDLRRQAAAERAAAMDIPTAEQEVWRYSRIGELELDRFHPVTSTEYSPPSVIVNLSRAAFGGATMSTYQTPTDVSMLVDWPRLSQSVAVHVTSNGAPAIMRSVRPRMIVASLLFVLQISSLAFRRGSAAYRA